MRIGLLGGTFDPIHKGHLAIAQETVDRKICDHILFIPAHTPLHRQASKITPIKHRQEMIRLAIAGNKAFELSDAEAHGVSYSYQTIEAIRKIYDDKIQISFIIGLDNFFDLPNWREPKRILKTCDLIVVSRPGWNFEHISLPQYKIFFGLEIEEQYFQALDAGTCNELILRPHVQTSLTRSITLLQLPTHDISSSQVRIQITKKEPINTLLPTPVESYILNAHLYSTESIRPES